MKFSLKTQRWISIYSSERSLNSSERQEVWYIENVTKNVTVAIQVGKIIPVMKESGDPGSYELGLNKWEGVGIQVRRQGQFQRKKYNGQNQERALFEGIPVSSDMIQLWKYVLIKLKKVRRRLCMSGYTLGMYHVKLILSKITWPSKPVLEYSLTMTVWKTD